MPNFRDLLPQPPWEGPPVPRRILPKRIWLVYVTPEGKWGASDITPDTLISDTLRAYRAEKELGILKPEDLEMYKLQFESQLSSWVTSTKLDADAQLARGKYKEYWIVEAPTRYRAIKVAQKPR